MKIYTHILLGVLTLGLAVGSKAASFGVLPGGLPLGTRVGETSKSDTVFANWRTPGTLTVSDFGIAPTLKFTTYNPNVKKYTPSLYLSNNKGNVNSRLGLKRVSSLLASTSRSLPVQAVKEPKLLPSLNAYPNPSRGVTRISMKSLGDDNYKIRISNAIGKVYKEISVSQPSSTETIEVDLSLLPAGIYFYSLLVNEKMVETKRLILQQQ